MCKHQPIGLTNWHRARDNREYVRTLLSEKGNRNSSRYCSPPSTRFLSNWRARARVSTTATAYRRRGGVGTAGLRGASARTLISSSFIAPTHRHGTRPGPGR